MVGPLTLAQSANCAGDPRKWPKLSLSGLKNSRKLLMLVHSLIPSSHQQSCLKIVKDCGKLSRLAVSCRGCGTLPEVANPTRAPRAVPTALKALHALFSVANHFPQTNSSSSNEISHERLLFNQPIPPSHPHPPPLPLASPRRNSVTPIARKVSTRHLYPSEVAPAPSYPTSFNRSRLPSTDTRRRFFPLRLTPCLTSATSHRLSPPPIILSKPGG